MTSFFKRLHPDDLEEEMIKKMSLAEIANSSSGAFVVVTSNMHCRYVTCIPNEDPVEHLHIIGYDHSNDEFYLTKEKLEEDQQGEKEQEESDNLIKCSCGAGHKLTIRCVGLQCPCKSNGRLCGKSCR